MDFEAFKLQVLGMFSVILKFWNQAIAPKWILELVTRSLDDYCLKICYVFC